MSQNIDQQELAKFSSLNEDWWNEEGALKTLHQINPVRLSYLEEKVNLQGKQILDIGCGGGILTESLAKKGAAVTGIDAEPALITIAKQHYHETCAKNSLLAAHPIDYQAVTVEAFAALTTKRFDVVTCLELLEHVPDPLSVIQAASAVLKPGGHLFLSTLNRTVKAYLLAIVAGEYLLKLLPRGTHDYAKFIRPSELSAFVQAAHLIPKETRGLAYSPFSQAHLTDDVAVNYLFYAVKPACE